MKVTRALTHSGERVHFSHQAEHRPPPRFAEDHPLLLVMSQCAEQFVCGTRGGLVVRRVRDGRVYAESTVPRGDA